MTIEDVINNSEVAGPRHIEDDRVSSTCFQEINRNIALKISGQTLYERGTIVLTPSSHPFLAEQYNEYRISRKGVNIKWPKKGTQPYSTQGHALGVFSGISTNNAVLNYLRFYRNDGNLYYTFAGETVALGNISFIILEACGAGAGGKTGGMFSSGKGGGSGAFGLWLVDLRSFTSTSMLEIYCPPGSDAGESGGNLIITSSAQGNSGGITVYGGNKDGTGGQTPSYTGNIKNIFATLAESKGDDASSQEGASVPDLQYTEPNPSQIISKTHSYKQGFGAGGRGGEAFFKKGESGSKGGVIIFY